MSWNVTGMLDPHPASILIFCVHPQPTAAPICSSSQNGRLCRRGIATDFLKVSAFAALQDCKNTTKWQNHYIYWEDFVCLSVKQLVIRGLAWTLFFWLCRKNRKFSKLILGIMLDTRKCADFDWNWSPPLCTLPYSAKLRTMSESSLHEHSSQKEPILPWLFFKGGLIRPSECSVDVRSVLEVFFSLFVAPFVL